MNIISQLAAAQEAGKKVFLFEKKGKLFVDSSGGGRIYRCIMSFFGGRNYQLTAICGLKLEEKKWKQLPENQLLTLFKNQVAAAGSDRAKVKEVDFALAYVRQKVQKKVGMGFFDAEYQKVSEIKAKLAQVDQLEGMAKENQFEAMSAIIKEGEEEHLKPYRVVNSLNEGLKSGKDPLTWMPSLLSESEKLKPVHTFLTSKIEENCKSKKDQISKAIQTRMHESAGNKTAEEVFAEEITWFEQKEREKWEIANIESENGLTPKPLTDPTIFLSNIKLLQNYFMNYRGDLEGAIGLVEAVNNHPFLPRSIALLAAEEYWKVSNGVVHTPPKAGRFKSFFKIDLND